MDEKRQVIHGDFNGQLANRDINNHHYTESRLLNEAEAWEIKNKVAELITLTGKPDKQVWGELKKILGNGLRELCLNQEKAAHAILDLWIERARSQDASRGSDVDNLVRQNSQLAARLDTVQAALATAIEAKGLLQEKLAQHITAATQQAQQAQRQIDALRQAKPARPLCQTCSSATANLAKARRGVVTMGVTAMLALAATSYLSFTHFQTRQALKAVQARLTVCEFAGLPYSLGAVLVRQNEPDWRCAANNGAVAWEEIKRKSKGKP